MEAKPTKVIEYFNGQKQNLIPLFQRPYTWSQKNWQTLWDDIKIQIELNDASSHFMGAIVSVPARSVPVGVNKFLIIDGQQRLTTISILLCALRDCSDFNLSERIHNVYLTNQYTEKEDTLKFVPTQADREEYCKLVLEKVQHNNESKLLTAYNFFKKKITSDTDSNDIKIEPEKVFEILVNSLEVVMINLSENDDPYLIFESLNFKGEPLTQADLVRNYILMRFKHSITQGGEQEKIYNNYWQPIEKLLHQKDDLTEFLRHYMMKDGKDIKHKGIYSEIKEKLKSSDTPEKTELELRDMLANARHYASFLRPDEEKTSEIKKRLSNIRTLNVTTAYPLMLRLFESRLKNELTEKHLADC